MLIHPWKNCLINQVPIVLDKNNDYQLMLCKQIELINLNYLNLTLKVLLLLLNLQIMIQ
mgnify:CR=1 FL=1